LIVWEGMEKEKAREEIRKLVEGGLK